MDQNLLSGKRGTTHNKGFPFSPIFFATKSLARLLFGDERPPSNCTCVLLLLLLLCVRASREINTVCRYAISRKWIRVNTTSFLPPFVREFLCRVVNCIPAKNTPDTFEMVAQMFSFFFFPAPTLPFPITSAASVLLMLFAPPGNK